MDLGEFTDSVLELLNDDFLETHEQALALVSGLSYQKDDIACVFGIDPLAYGMFLDPITEEKSVYSKYAGFDRKFIGNTILQRVNEVLHWKRNYDELMGGTETETEEIEDHSEGLSEDRQACFKFLEKKVPDMPKHLVEELESEIFETHGHDKRHYRGRIRSLVNNFLRNDQLLGDFLRGAIPVRWLAQLNEKAFATKKMKEEEKKIREEWKKEALLDPESAALFAKAKRWHAVRTGDDDDGNEVENGDGDGALLTIMED